jgi:hypothetical protein
MTNTQTIIAILTLVLGGLGAGFKLIWPYFRDTYLPAKLRHSERQTVAQEQIAELVRGIHQGQQTIVTGQAEIKTDVRAVRDDLAVLKERQQPARRRKQESMHAGS